MERNQGRLQVKLQDDGRHLHELLLLVPEEVRELMLVELYSLWKCQFQICERCNLHMKNSAKNQVENILGGNLQ